MEDILEILYLWIFEFPIITSLIMNIFELYLIGLALMCELSSEMCLLGLRPISARWLPFVRTVEGIMPRKCLLEFLTVVKSCYYFPWGRGRVLKPAEWFDIGENLAGSLESGFSHIPKHPPTPVSIHIRKWVLQKDGLTIPVCSRVEEVTRKKSFCLLQDCGGKRLVCPEKSAEGWEESPWVFPTSLNH